MANTISPRRRRHQYVGRWPDIHIVLMVAVSDRLGPAALRPLTAASIVPLGQSGQCPTSTRFRRETNERTNQQINEEIIRSVRSITIAADLTVSQSISMQ